jgi:N-methylhydantoinase A/oxoprolinase/acetone carboxylase beta subunit
VDIGGTFTDCVAAGRRIDTELLREGDEPLRDIVLASNHQP